MAVLDDVIGQQMSQYPGAVQFVSLPPPPATLQRYPDEAQSGQPSPMLLERLRQQQRQQTLDQLLNPGGAPSGATISAAPAPAPFGFHGQYQEPPDPNVWRSLGLPEWMHPYYQQIQRASNVLPGVIRTEEAVPRTLFEGMMRPMFRTLFTGTPFASQNALTRRVAGLSPSLPGRTAMGAIADPASKAASTIFEMSGGFPVLKIGDETYGQRGPIPEEILGGRRTLSQIFRDAVFGTEWQKAQRRKDMEDEILNKLRMSREERQALNRRLPTGILEQSGPMGGPVTVQQGPMPDMPHQWYEKKYGGTDYMERYKQKVLREQEKWRAGGKPPPLTTKELLELLGYDPIVRPPRK
jgi:hypothetical protein